MKSFLGYIANKIVQSTPRSKKVGPTIKSVKPNLKKTVSQTKSDEYVKRIRELEKFRAGLNSKFRLFSAVRVCTVRFRVF